MIGHPPRHTAFSIIATLGLVASNLSAGSAERPEGPSLSLSAPTVTLAARCDLQLPIATVHIRAHNHGNAPSSPLNIRVLDTAHQLAGSAELSQVAAHEARSIDVPISVDPSFDPSKNPAAIVGDHTLGVYLSNPQSPHKRPASSVADISTTIPGAFCVQSSALGAPKSSSQTKAPGPSLASARPLFGSQAQVLFGGSAPAAPIATANSAAPASSAAANPAVAASIAPASPAIPASIATATPAVHALIAPANSAIPASIATANPAVPSTAIKARTVPLALVTPTPALVLGVGRYPIGLPIGVPVGLRAATNTGDCEAHLHANSQFGGQIGGVVSCQSMMSSGNLVLIWDAPSDASVDGYRLYALAGVERGAATATFKSRMQTLANLPPITSGAVPQCYVVTATRGSNESPAGPAYCAHEATVTRTLDAMYDRGAWQDRSHIANAEHVNRDFVGADYIPAGPVVGYYDAENTSFWGDSSYTKIRRYAVAFNVDADALRNKRLVSARLHLTIQSSYGAGNNHSCATTVGRGTEFWWKPDAATWIDGNFSDSPAQLSDTGPVVSADVTKQVAAIMAGGLNYGFVIRNDNEDLGAFMNAQCETVYGDPQLDLVYYDR